MRMTRISLGDTIEFRESTYLVEGISGPALLLRDTESGQPTTVLQSTIFTDATYRRIGDGGSQPGSSDLAENRRRDDAALLEALDQKQRDRIQRLVSAFVDILAPTPDRPGLAEWLALPIEERIIHKAKELSTSRSTLFRQYSDWRDRGVWGLVDKRTVRFAEPLFGVDARVAQAIREQATVELQESGATYARFRRRLAERLVRTHGADVALPGDRTLRRAFGALASGTTALTAHQRQVLGRVPQRAFHPVAASRPGQYVVFDGTVLDVLALDPIHDKAYAIELVAAVDLYSRSLLAWRLVPKGSKGIDAALLLADMLAPIPMRPEWDDRIRFEHMQLPYDRMVSVDERLALAAARPVILPETVVIDHGKMFTGEVFTSACARLGIHIQPARVETPTDKPSVERMFGTVNTMFCQHLRGYKGPNISERGVNAEDSAHFTLEEIADLFEEFVLSIYQRRSHSGLVVAGTRQVTRSPNDAYAEGIARCGWVPAPTDRDLYFELLPIAWRKIQPDGVDFNNRTYDDPGGRLLELRNSTNPYPDGKGKWPFRYDPRNLLHVYTKDVNGEWFALRWTQAPDSLQPFSDIAYRHAREYVKARQLAGEAVGSADVAIALLDLQQRSDDPILTTARDKTVIRKSRARTRQARVDAARAGISEPDGPTTELRLVEGGKEQEFTLEQLRTGKKR